MFSNELALKALDVRFVAQYVRNPFAMRYGTLELPVGVSYTTHFHATKNGYFHAFHGRNQSSSVSNRNRVEQKLFGSMIRVLRLSGISKELSEGLSQSLAQFETKCYNHDAECSHRQFHNFVRMFKTERTQTKGQAWLRSAHDSLDLYEQRQEQQEQLFGEWCDAPIE